MDQWRTISWEQPRTLNVNTPLLRVETEGLESSLLAEPLSFVDMLVSAVVASAGVAFRILVLHDTAESIEDGAGSEVFGGDEIDEVVLSILFLSWGQRQCIGELDID